MQRLKHPTLFFTRWRALLDEGTLLGTDLDAVLEGYEQVPIAPEPTHEGVTLPPLTADERAVIEGAEQAAKLARERALFVVERGTPPAVEPRSIVSPSERSASARAASLERVARENEVKRARVREVIARHLAATSATGAKE